MPTILAERYRLDTLIGGGGMGEVWQAHDEVLNREVAVKVIRAHLAEDDTIRERLRTEAQLAGSLHHPGIVDVYDYGEHQEDDGRTTPFLVMPLIEGVSLSAMLKSRVALPIGETMAIIAEMAEALQTAHEAGIVHRDLKPANVMLTPAGRVMILDFGIARSTEGESLTQTGALIGTADYLSPEQAAGKQATFESDLYALGIVAYTCLTGIPPFHRETDIATALAHVQAAVPDLPEELVASGVGPLIEGLLAKEPSQRPAASQVAAIAAGMATTVPTDAETTTDPEAIQPGAAPVAVADPDATQPAVAPAAAAGAAATVGAAATQTDLTPVDDAAATSEVAVAEHPRRRRTVMVSSAVLAIAAVIFALLYATGAEQVEVPDVRKMTAVEAATTLSKAGLKVKTHDVDAAGYGAQQVVTQSAKPGSEVDENSVVDLGVATGFVAIPKGVVGKSYEDAVKILEKLDLKPEARYEASGEDVGTVTAADPSKRARPGDTVVLTVSTGPGGFDDGNDKKEKDEKEDKGKDKDKDEEDTPTEPVDPEPTETTEPTTEPPPPDEEVVITPEGS